MKESLKRAAGGLRAGRELYRKLGRVERISVILVAALLCFAILALSWPDGWSGGDGGYRQVAIAEAAEGGRDLQRWAARLQDAGIEWREGIVPGGGRSLEVPEASVALALKALELEGSRSSLGVPADASEKGSIFETPDRLEARLREASRAQITKWILLNGNIRSAAIVLSPLRRGAILAQSRDVGETAAVVLFLRPGISSLRRQDVEAIRDTVCGAFALRPERIRINDNLGNSYPALTEPGGSSLVLDKEDHLRVQIKEEIRAIYGSTFAENEFHVGVMVSLSPQRSSIEKKAVERNGTFALETKSVLDRVADPQSGGILSAGAAPIVLRETVESAPFDSFERTTTDIPPGELKGVSVVAYFDLNAVERVEAARQEFARKGPSAPSLLPADREALVQAFTTKAEEAMGVLLSAHGSVHLSVMVHPFRRPQPEAEPDLPRIAGADASPLISEAGSWALRWWRPLLLAGSVLLLWAWIRIVARNRGRRSGAGSWPSPAGAQSADGAAAVTDPEWSASRSHRPADRVSVLRGVEDLNSSVLERPEAAASVLRLWLAQDNEESREEIARA